MVTWSLNSLNQQSVYPQKIQHVLEICPSNNHYAELNYTWLLHLIGVKAPLAARDSSKAHKGILIPEMANTVGV